MPQCGDILGTLKREETPGKAQNTQETKYISRCLETLWEPPECQHCLVSCHNNPGFLMQQKWMDGWMDGWMAFSGLKHNATTFASHAPCCLAQTIYIYKKMLYTAVVVCVCSFSMLPDCKINCCFYTN